MAGLPGKHRGAAEHRRDEPEQRGALHGGDEQGGARAEGHDSGDNRGHGIGQGAGGPEKDTDGQPTEGHGGDTGHGGLDEQDKPPGIPECDKGNRPLPCAETGP